MFDEKSLYVIDFDRTLSDVPSVMKLAEKTCGNLNIDFEEIRQSQLAAEKQAIPYSPLKSVSEKGPEMLSRFKEEFIRLADPGDLLFPDGIRFLDKLDQKNRQYMILTYAIEEDWQKLKLKACGLDRIPHIITFNMVKSIDINSWQKENGEFVIPLPGLTPSRHLIVIDDRNRIFNNLSPDCEGFLIDRTGGAADVSELSTGIRRITSFDDIVDRI